MEQFISYLLSRVGKSLYVWGAQGESLKSLAMTFVSKHETSRRNTERVSNLMDKLVPGDLYMYDCSGLGVCWLLENKILKSDTTAAGLYNMCKKIAKGALQRGDMVFIKGSGGVTHVGYIINNRLDVCEAAGRDHGVIIRPLNQGSPNGMWNAFGQPSFIGEPVTALYRRLEVSEPYRKGADVLAVQNELRSRGYEVDCDGVYGSRTAEAAEAFQRAGRLSIKDWGDIGKKTAKALGFNWSE